MNLPRPAIFGKYPTVLIVLLALSIFLTNIHCLYLHIEAKTTDIQDVPYAYRVDVSQLGITPNRIILLDKQRALVVGAIAGTQGIIIVRVGDPYSGAVVEDVYPLTGNPTSIATDGYPLSRIVVASDKGEILLLRVDEGKITRHLYAILGADFYIYKVMLAGQKTTGFKVFALVSEDGPPTYPCLNCHIYILDEDASGVMRIGPRTGNATATCRDLDGARVQEIAPLLIYTDRTYYYDVSRVAVSYIPRIISLEFSVYYTENTTQNIVPAPNVLVEVQLRYVDQGTTITYGVNADENGFVRVPIPRVERTSLQIRLIIRDVIGRTLYNYSYTYDPLIYKEIPDTIPLPNAILPFVGADTRPASTIYPVPPFLQPRLDIFDFSQAPFTCRKVYSADFLMEPSYINLIYLKGGLDDNPKLIYYDHTYGYTYISVLSEDGGRITQRSIVRDYIGRGVKIISSGTYIDGKYIVVGVSDGRLRLYVREGSSYRMKSLYVLGSELINLIAIPGRLGYTYVAVSSSGIQVIRVEPYQIPVFRGLSSLYLTTPGFIDGDILGDLSTTAIINTNEIIIVKNADALIKSQRFTTLDQIMVLDINVFLSVLGDADLRESILELIYPGGSFNYTLMSNSITFRNIIPEVIYTINVYPAVPYLRTGSLTFKVSWNRSIEVLSKKDLDVVLTTGDQLSIEIILHRDMCKLKVELLDPYGIIGSFRLLANNAEIAIIKGASTEVEIPCGVYRIFVEPTVENAAYYERSGGQLVDLSRNTTTRVSLNRKTYTLRLNVVEGDNPIRNARVRVVNTITGATVLTLQTDFEGSISTSLPSGTYMVEVSHGDYSTESINVALLKDTSVTVEMKPTIVTLIFRYMPMIIGAIALAAIIYISMKIKARIEARIAKEEYI